MRYLLLILSLLVAQPAAAIIIKQGPGGSGDASVRSAADCTAETGGTEDEVCVETGTGQGVFRCSTATCEGAGWERADDTVGAGGGIVNTIAAVDGGGASSGADIIMGTGAGLDTFHAGDTITYSFDPTELGNLTWGTGSQLAWTFNAGATDPVMTVNSDQVDWTNVAAFTLDTEQVISTPVGDGESLAVTGSGSVEATLVTVPATTTAGQSPLAVDQAVHVNGYDAVNGCVEVILADADDGALMPAIGISTATLTDGDCDGEVTVSGTAVGAFGALTPNDSLYVSATAGALTSTKPTGTALIQKLAEALQEGGASDRIQIFGAGRSNDVPNIPDGQAWIGDGTGVAVATNLVTALSENGGEELAAEVLGTACTVGQVIASDGSGGMDCAAAGGAPATADISDVSVTQTELAELETIGTTVIEAADWTAVAALPQTTVSGNAGTVTFADAAADTTTFVALGTAATGSLAPATDAGMAYNASTNALTVTGAVDTGAHTAPSYTADPSATPTWATQDSNMGGTPDQNTLVIANCPTGTTAGGDEDCDLAFQTQVAGTPTEAFRIDTTDGGTQTVVFTADPVFPADAVITADITNSNVTEDKLAADLAFDDGDSLDLTGITLSATGEGLIITSPADCDAITGVTTGTVCYDTTDDAICVYDGAAMDCQDLGAAGSGDVTDVMNCAGPDCGDIAAADGDSLDLTGVTLNATGEGLILTSPADCDAITGVSTGTICYDTTDDSICVFDGAAMDCQVLGGGGGETFAQTLALGADGNDVDMTSLGRLEFFDAGLYFDADADGVMDITSDGTLELHSADWDISTTGVITGAGNITSDGTVTAVTVSGNAAADLDVDANGQNVTLGDGGTTNYLAVADDGTMTTNGSAGIYTDSTVSIPAAAWVLSTTPPTEATYGTNYPESVLDFATDADDQAFIKLAIPTDFNDTNQANMTWVIRWTADTATVGDVCLCIAADPLQNGDDPDLNTGTVTGCADITVAGADDLEETTFTMAASTFETAEMMNVRLYRDVDAGHGDCTADDMADDASVIAVTLNYGVLKQ